MQEMENKKKKEQNGNRRSKAEWMESKGKTKNKQTFKRAGVNARMAFRRARMKGKGQTDRHTDRQAGRQIDINKQRQRK